MANLNQSFDDVMKTRKIYVKERNKFTKHKKYLNCDEIRSTVHRIEEVLNTLTE